MTSVASKKYITSGINTKSVEYSKQVSYFTIGNIVTLFFQWLVIMVVPKITNFEEAGTFAIAISVSSIINQIATFSLNQHQVADNNRHFHEADFAIVRIITIALSFICIIPIVLLYQYDIKQVMIIVAYSIYRNGINYAYLHIASLQMINKLDYVGKCMVIEGIISFSTFVISYVFTNNLLISTTAMAFIGAGTFIFILNKGYYSMYNHRYPFKSYDKKNVRALMLIGSSILLSMLCPIIITALPKLILEQYWGEEIVGYFSTITAPTIVIPTIAGSIFTPFISHFSKLSHSNNMKKIRTQYLRIAATMIIGGTVLFLFSSLLSEPLFSLIYGESITPYAKYFDDLVFGITIYSIGMCGITILITKEQEKAAGISALISLLVSVVVFYLMIPTADGMWGATYSLTISYCIFTTFISLAVLILPLKSVCPDSPEDYQN